MPNIIYKPLEKQRQFHFSRKPKVCMLGGLGAGKTHSLAMKLFMLMNENENFAGGILCPTLKMFKKDVFPTVRSICEDNNIEYEYNKTDSQFFFPDTNSTVYVFHSEDEGRSIRGPNLAFMLINEFTLCSKEAFQAAIARVRVKGAKLLQVAMSGTPESFNWAYEYFIEKPREDTELIFASSRDNYNLDSGYISMLEGSFDELMRQQFVEGKFVNLTGRRAAWGFDRSIHVTKVKRDRELPIWVSLDFNVDNMAATFWNRHAIDSTIALSAFSDVKLKSSNTYDMAEYIKANYGSDVTIYPDPAGNARSTKSTVSDIDILRQSGFKDIKFKRSIRSVRECLNSLNNLFDKRKIEIDLGCKNLIADLDQCILKSNGLEIDKSNADRSHWIDGLKDMADYEFPVMKQKFSEMRQF